MNWFDEFPSFPGMDEMDNQAIKVMASLATSDICEDFYEDNVKNIFKTYHSVGQWKIKLI